MFGLRPAGYQSLAGSQSPVTVGGLLASAVARLVPDRSHGRFVRVCDCTYGSAKLDIVYYHSILKYIMSYLRPCDIFGSYLSETSEII